MLAGDTNRLSLKFGYGGIFHSCNPNRHLHELFHSMKKDPSKTKALMNIVS